MAEIQVAPLSEWLSEQEMVEVASALERVGSPRMPHPDHAAAPTMADDLDATALEELMERLEAHDLACDIYLPIEFEGRVEAADLRLGSAPCLVETLEDLKDELGLSDEDDDEDDDELDYRGGPRSRGLKEVWHALYDGAHDAAERHLALRVQG